ncbi:hypothetical protein [Streptomyces sp. RFCAC02]|uniref:hypothetical protein n=1 Tax=Streptomyces sp. RFCAC02 TaxID=2499143 RepID=UPI0010224FE9|nr:hypothetical protein [Streptomyces sp. RFCAC02]
MVTICLLVALTFFVFAQAASLRNGGQSAADAAALAAAQEARDTLFDDLIEAVADGEGDLSAILQAQDVETAACSAAQDLAGRNGASVEECVKLDGRAGYRVTVRTEASVGDTIIPGTEGRHAVLEAVAVIEGLCTAESGDESDPGETPDDDDPGDGEDEGGGEQDDATPVTLDCEDREWVIDPDDNDTGDLPDPRDLFRVHLEN